MNPAPLLKLSEVPGLDPRGLAPFDANPEIGPGLCDERDPHDDRAILSEIDSGKALVWSARHNQATWTPIAGLQLSLADSATRDRAARWLAGRVGVECESTAPEWRAVREIKPRGWILCGGAWFVFGPGHSLIDLEVPALAGLDPSDDTRLPDGSRLVDAQALAAVCRAVGGAR